jgi:hypothetical protein
MNRSKIVFVIIGSVLIIALITNPSPDKHREQVQIDLVIPVENVVGSEMTLTILDLLTSNVTSTNYFVFSQTIYLNKDKRNIIGIGVFGRVYLFDDYITKFQN